MKKLLFTLLLMMFCSLVEAQNYTYAKLYSPSGTLYTSSSCSIDAGKEAYFKPSESSTTYSSFKLTLGAKVSGLQVIVYNKSGKAVNTVDIPSTVTKYDVSVYDAAGTMAKIGLKNTGSAAITVKTPVLSFVATKVATKAQGVLSYLTLGNGYPTYSTATISGTPSTSKVVANFAAGQYIGWGMPHDVSSFKAFVVNLSAATTTKLVVTLNYKNGTSTDQDTCWIPAGKTSGVVRLKSNYRAYLNNITIKADAAASNVTFTAPFLLSDETFTVSGSTVTDSGIGGYTFQTINCNGAQGATSALCELYDLSAQTMTSSTYAVTSSSQSVDCSFNYADRFFLWNYSTPSNFNSYQVKGASKSSAVLYVVVKLGSSISLASGDYLRLCIAPNDSKIDFWSTGSNITSGQTLCLDVANATNASGTKITYNQLSKVQWLKLLKHVKGTGVKVVDAYCVLSSSGYSAVEEIFADEVEVVKTEFYTIGGQKIDVPAAKGVTIVKKTYADGSVKTMKVYGCRF